MPVKKADSESLRNRIIGLGEKSIHKSYYPELQSRLAELERFRSMLDQSSDIIFLLNFPDLLIYDVTTPVVTHLGWTQEELVGSSFLNILDEETSQCFQKKMDTAWHDRQEREVFTALIRGKIPMEFVCSPVVFEGNRFLIIVGQEISQRLAAEQQIRRQLFQLDTLHHIDNLITANLSLSDLLTGVLSEVRMALRANAAAIYIFDSPTKMKRIAWSADEIGVDGDTILLTTRHLPTLEYGEQILLNGKDGYDEAYSMILQRIQQYGFCAYGAEPLSTRGQIKGILEVYFRSPQEFNDDWKTLLTRVSAQVTVAVEKSQMFKHLEQAYADLNQAYDETLEGWAAALDLREKETANHSQKVVEMTIRLAHAAGIRADDLIHVRRGAFLHDIGKIAVPDSILLKPGPLSEDEWVIMRQHPVYAYQMLSKINYLKPAIEIPYCHHEKWDGSGYPQGLAGDAIPLAARVFAVVDVWQALTSDRVYRRAWPESNARKYIIDHSGTQFDPKVVEAFLKLVIADVK